MFHAWKGEFISYDPERFIGVSVVPMHDIAWAVTEQQRTLKKGLVAPIIYCQSGGLSVLLAPRL